MNRDTAQSYDREALIGYHQMASDRMGPRSLRRYSLRHRNRRRRSIVALKAIRLTLAETPLADPKLAQEREQLPLFYFHFSCREPLSTSLEMIYVRRARRSLLPVLPGERRRILKAGASQFLDESRHSR